MEQPSWIPLRLRESNSNPAGSAVLALAATGATVSGWQPPALRTPRHAASCTAAINATASTAGATSASDTAASSTANTATLPVPLLPAQNSKII